LSGFAPLAYEIVWFRAYRSIAGNSTFAFTIVLVTFLLGLGFGALALRKVIALGKAERSLCLVQLGIACTTAAGMASLSHFLTTSLGMSLSLKDPAVAALHWPLRLLLHGSAALIFMLPATLLMGLSFSLASKLHVGEPTRVGKRVGGAVLLANLGSILGSIGAATLLLPWLGSMGSTKLLVGVNVLLALGILASRPSLWAGSWASLIPGFAAVAVAIFFLPTTAPYPWNPLGRIESRVIFEEEDEFATVRVSQALANPAIRGMSIDGSTIGVSAGWRYPIYSKQIFLAHLPMWLEPRAQSVLQIGLGSASTLDALTQYPTLKNIESVEISAAVLRGAHFFAERRALSDPRVTVHIADAIDFLARDTARYDLIIADAKQNSDFSGNAKILSQEFYQLALKRLNEDGLFVQWISTTMLPEEFNIILRTATSVFPHLHLFFEAPASAFLVASLQPLEDRERMSPADVPPIVTQSLRSLGIAHLDWLRLGWMADRRALLQSVGSGAINRWADSVLEFSSYRAPPEARVASAYAENIDLLVDARTQALRRAPAGFLPREPSTRQAYDRIHRAFAELTRGNSSEARAFLQEANRLSPEDPVVHNAMRWLAGP